MSINKQPPSLASLSFEAGSKSLASDEARFLMVATKGVPDIDDIDMINHTEMSHIAGARGRILGSDGKYNHMGIVNGARFSEYSSDTGIVTIRVDDINVPEFWMEIPVDMAQLKAWIKQKEEEENQQ